MKSSTFPITSEFFCHNRLRLRQLFDNSSPIVITANGVLQKSADNPYPFRQDSDFWYLTGLYIEDAVLVLEEDSEYVILPDLDDSYVAFLGNHNLDEYADTSGIREFVDAKEGWERLGKQLKKSKAYATIEPPKAYLEHHHMYTNPARAALCARVSGINHSIERIDLRTILARMRTIKQEPELLVMQAAFDITINALQQTIRQGLKKAYENEKQIKNEYVYQAALLGATTQSYDPIVASGTNACIMHYQRNNSPINTGTGVLIDVGSEVCMYGADITRTVFFGTISNRAKEIWQAVLDTQNHILEMLKPGVIPIELSMAADAFIGIKLQELGLINKVTPDNIREFFPHSIVHFIGIDLHDVGDYGAPLEEGMVLMIEPGIYVPKEKLGIRIEDPAVITKTGYRLLSSDLPRDIEARTLVLKGKKL